MGQGSSGKYYDQINEKGVREYIEAAAILTKHGGAIGPTEYCRGMAVEIALKLCWKGRGMPDNWKRGHDLSYLAGKLSDLTLTKAEAGVLESLNTNYYRDGDLEYPSRYRSSGMRVFGSPGQEQVESLLKTILSQQNP